MSPYDTKKIAVLSKTSEVLAIISGIFLSVSTIFMFVNMLTRTAADYNIRFVFELCSLCACGVASFAIPYATLLSAHSAMDLILSKASVRVKGGFEFVSGIITVAILAFTVYFLFMSAIDRTQAHELTTTAHFPTYIFRWIFAIGMLLTLIAAAVEMIDNFRIAKGEQVTTLASVANEAELELEEQIQEAILEAEEEAEEELEHEHEAELASHDAEEPDKGGEEA